MATQDFHIELDAAVAKLGAINTLLLALEAAKGHNITLPRPERGLLPLSSDKPDDSIQGAIKHLLDQKPHPIQPVSLTSETDGDKVHLEATVQNIGPGSVIADFYVYDNRYTDAKPLGVEDTGHLKLETGKCGTFTIEIPLRLCENQSPVLWVSTGTITPKAFLSLSLEDEEVDSEPENPEPGDEE